MTVGGLRLPLPVPSRADWIFSLRTSAAGLVAIALAWMLRLDQPQWAMMTVFIVSQPIAGMVLAKGIFRLIGTLVGALAAVGLATVAGHVPWLFVTLLAAWIAGCTFVASMLRNPEAYGAALAGYTAAIIGLPAFGQSHLLTELAAARCIEIMLGIVCAGLAGRLVLPQLARDMMVDRLSVAIVDLANYAAGPYRNTDRAALAAMDAKLIADTQALAAMRAYATLEAPGLVTHGRHARHTIGYLLAALSAARTLQARAGHPGAALAPFRLGLAAILDGMSGSADGLGELRPHLARIEALAAEARQRLDRPAVEDEDNVGIAARLTVLLEFLAALKAVLQGLAALRLRSPNAVDPRGLPALTVYRDRAAALANAVRAGAASLCVASFWMATNWADAAGVAIIVAVVSSLFASLPNPIQSAWAFFKGTLLAAPFAFVVGQLLLPAFPGFLPFALFSVPVLVIAGLAMADPRLAGTATPFAINFLVFLNPHQQMMYSPLAFLNGTASILVGILLSIAVFAVVLPQRPQETAARLIETLRGDLLRLCLHDRIPRPSAFESLAYDRVNQLIPLLQRQGEPGKALLDGCVASAMLGLEILRLRRSEQSGLLPPDTVLEANAGLRRFADLIQSRPRSLHAVRDTAAALQASAAQIGVAGAPPPVLHAAASLRLIAAITQDHPIFFERRAGEA